MRSWALFLVLFSGCANPPLPAQRPSDFSIEYRRSGMTAPVIGDSWRLDGAGWRFDSGMGDKAIFGPAEPEELDSAYQLVRDARLDLMESEARNVRIHDGHSESLTINLSGKTNVLATGTQYQLVEGSWTSYRRAVDGLRALADRALARLNRGGPTLRTRD